ncbi:PREDICTED: uncharacterized protein LOC109153850 [Ipomoea nil]|uniref:uncharacterized protein LOC109153850 n=1 Tax=Ipomoea nil TaxID=35883 RepID=UPI0009012143|nr:PREDICTED: uncharacterized protein LOC109153850 [Ipomoea nil]XP_019157285.1 PREDICTED: uncharacterized protein LOC109153850 [Ipomoea nil]
MASNLEPVPVTSQKHDPAWKHCQMYKNGDRVQLKCIYCGKVFKGGGIHRIKEHLAGQKGNASTCLRVQPDVRLLMQESLNGAAMKKRKKQKLIDEMMNTHPGEAVDLSNQCELSSEVGLLPVPDSLGVFESQEEGMSSKLMGRKKKGRIRKASSSGNTNMLGVTTSKQVVNNATRMNDQVHMAIARFLLDAGIPFEAVKSSYFQPMIDVIASQEVGITGPSYHELRSWILKNSIQELRNEIDQCSGSWVRNGCSILVDEWTTEKGKSLIKFSVYCPEGTMFLRSVDVSEIVNSGDALYELLKEVVEEVGARNVLQVITSSEERYIDAGRRLTDAYPTVFWTPCAAQCIDMMLEDIKKLEWVNATLGQAKAISRFMYNNNSVLNLMRRHTYGVDLVELGVTVSATDFLTLKRMVNIKHNLHSMVTSEEWMESPYSKKAEGYAVLDLISSQSFWSSCSLITHLTDPLLRLLCIVCSEKRSGMGYVYAGLYRAKEIIKKELGDKNDYSVYWNIIDHRWHLLQRHPLHAAGFYLNPRFFYSTEEDVHLHLRSLVYDCIERLVPDPKIQDRIVKETSCYKNAAGDFGRKMAVRARETLLPGEWWATYGGGCPNLSRLAIRILSQTCGLMSSMKANHVCLEQMHETSNCLEHRRLKDIVFVQSNLRLREQKNREQGPVDPISYENIELVKDWVSEKELCSEEPASSDWMAVDPPLGNTLLFAPALDDFEALGAGFGDYEIFDGVKDIKDENGEDTS